MYIKFHIHTYDVMNISDIYIYKRVVHNQGCIWFRHKPNSGYIDWIATTPLMLFELCMIGGAEKHTTILIIGCDLMMLTGGIVSAMVARLERAMRGL